MRSLKDAFCVLAFLAGFLPCTGTAQIARIEKFESEIEIDPHGNAEIVEQVTLDVGPEPAAGSVVRTVVRKPPAPAGIDLKIRIEDVTAERAGEPQRVILTFNDTHIRLSTGSRKGSLEPGRHVFRWTYHLRGAVHVGESHTEFHWDVTGSDWRLLIARANAAITLPSGSNLLATAVRTGLPGARDRDFEISQGTDGRINVRTTKPLVPGEGMRLTIAWANPSSE